MLGATFLLTIILKVDTFFHYSDCDDSCKQSFESCTIMEISPDNFPYECLKDEIKCANLASDFEVCLRPNKSPLGGKSIWNDFQKHKVITTTTQEPFTTTEKPIKPEIDSRSVIMIILGISTVLSISLNLFLICKRKTRRQPQYETMTDSENPYRDTTEHLEEN